MKKILLYNSGGGLGDSIQLFSLILSLQNHFKSSKFFYLGAHKNHFNEKLKEFNIKIDTLNLGLKYFGFRWWHFLFVKKKFNNLNLEKIDLIIDLQSKIRNTIILKKIPHINFFSSTFDFKLCSKKVIYSNSDYLLNLSTFLNEKIEKVNFTTRDLSNKFLDEAKKLLPNKDYVGLSMTQGNFYRKKSWSKEKFIKLAKKIKEKNKKPVFLIEKGNIELINEIKKSIPDAIIPEENSEMSCPALVTALATRLDSAISIDNGIMHMIGLTEVKLIVLFGPTSSVKFAPSNKNTIIIDSKVRYGTPDIEKITVDEVIKYI